MLVMLPYKLVMSVPPPAPCIFVLTFIFSGTRTVVTYKRNSFPFSHYPQVTEGYFAAIGQLTRLSL